MEQKYIRFDTLNSTYVLRVNEVGHLENLYYGPLLASEENLTQLFHKRDNMLGTSTGYDASVFDNAYSLDARFFEVGTAGKGDYRKPSIIFLSDNGYSQDYKFVSFNTRKVSEVTAEGFPLPHDASKYYEIEMYCAISNSTIYLDYLIFKESDVILRRVRFSGIGRLEKISSFNLDIVNNNYEVFATYGTWGNEAHPFTHKLMPGVFELQTNAGPSSNRHNPFFLVKEQDATLNSGIVYGFNLIYSGPFSATIERTFDNRLRIQHGINDDLFAKTLQEGESFVTPWGVLTTSTKGENGVSQNFHHFIQNHLVRSPFAKSARPILLNNWEGTYFDFNAKKLKYLIDDASQLGIELFVLDDGWFINRDDDRGGLSNYEVNKKKLPGGLKEIANYANKKGMKFGLWFEPEMISKDSKLYEEHPEYAVMIPDVSPSPGRNQYSLDLSNKDVQKYIIDNVSAVLESANIEYVKWDYNRNLSDFYPSSRVFESFFYDYTKGLYAILEVLMNKYPTILWEGCASGGNRFDLGILSYFDQIWVSDTSDAYERIRMHRTLAKAYPLSVMSGHVSAIPNHQLLRNIPLQTRFNNAFMSGGFGYELDLAKLTPLNKKFISEGNNIAKLFSEFVINGNYYEFKTNSQKEKYSYGVISEDKKHALVLVSNGSGSILPETLTLPALPLLEEAFYEVTTMEQITDIGSFGSLLKRVLPKFIKYDGPIINYLRKRKSTEELINIKVQENYVASGKLLRSGKLSLYPEWTGTGVGPTTRSGIDFNSVLYFISIKDK